MTLPAFSPVVRAARLVGPLLALFGVACSATKEVASRAPVEEVDTALLPHTIALSLRAAGGGRFHGTSLQRITDPKAPQDENSLPDSVTTTTDVWLDRHGNYRLLESNDREGGREIILHDKTLGVALRYGKMVRRPAQEPEPTRYLDEALGAPEAAWQLLRRFIAVEKTAAGTYRLLKAGAPAAPVQPEEPTALQKWRQTVDVKTLSGEARVDPSSGALLGFRLTAHFTLTRNGAPLEGELATETQLSELGKTPAVGPPVADELKPRQRTILEERALLGRDVASVAKPPTGTPAPRKPK